jgi:hypothetical protein
MDRSKWEIILEELTRMGFIVKREHVSDGYPRKGVRFFSSQGKLARA